MLTLSSIFTGLAVLVALFALWRARAAAKRIERLSESYWELRYEHGQLRARVTRLEPPLDENPPSEASAKAGVTAFVPLSSLTKR